MPLRSHSHLFANLRTDGLTAQLLVPLKATVCGLVTAESPMFNVALRAPVAVGVNTMLTVQLAPAASVGPQVVALCRKSPAFGPLKVMLEIVSAVGSVFLIVTFLLPLVAPTRAVNASDAGLTVTG